MAAPEYPMRINKYLALRQYCTRRDADALVAAGKVRINGRTAALGDKVAESDTVEVRIRTKHYRYFAFNKPRGIVTHSPRANEADIARTAVPRGVFPVGRLDKDSRGLIILTDDGRITDRLLNPDRAHEKEYVATAQEALPSNFRARMERGVDIGGSMTRPCTVRILGTRKFSITLTEGKKHQIRRMCAALKCTVTDLQRVRIMSVRLGPLKAGAWRPIEGTELRDLLRSLGMR